MNRFSLTQRSSLLAIACASALALAPAFAKDPVEADGKSNSKGKSTQADKVHAHAEHVAIPECIEKLKLSKEQHEKITGIVRNYDVSLDLVWKQFSARYMETIKVESALLAAIEDDLTDAQRLKVRDHRRKTAQHEKAVEGTNDKPNQETAKAESAVEQEIGLVGVVLTKEQESAADKVQEKYQSHLRSLNRDIQGLHTRLVSLEADKLVEIEKVLTKEQLVLLREHRQHAPVAPKVIAVNKGDSKKAE